MAQDSFKVSPDPNLIEKVRDLVGFYMNPPDAAAVFAVDETPARRSIGQHHRCLFNEPHGEQRAEQLREQVGLGRAGSRARRLSKNSRLLQPLEGELDLPAEPVRLEGFSRLELPCMALVLGPRGPVNSSRKRC